MKALLIIIAFYGNHITSMTTEKVPMEMCQEIISEVQFQVVAVERMPITSVKLYCEPYPETKPDG